MLRAMFLSLLLLVGCREQVNPQPEAGDVYSIPAFDWHVVEEQVLRRVYANAGMPLAEGQKLHGFVATTEEGGQVVVTMVPKHVDDSVTCTLGHEVMHLALGNYHR